MELRISEEETKEAVKDWLANKGINVESSQLQPIYEQEGQYDDAISRHAGFRVAYPTES